MDKNWFHFGNSSSSSAICFNTENKYLKTFALNANEGLKISKPLTNFNTRNRILQEFKNDFSGRKLDIHRTSLSSSIDEPVKKKIRSGNILKEAFETNLGEDIICENLQCEYEFDWPDDLQDDKTTLNFSTTDVTLNSNRKKLAKENLVNVVSISLIQGPNLKNANDPFRQKIIECCQILDECDPEFILKLALYTRQELNIRTTANLLLAYASNSEKCRHYLKRYFNISVVLPTDWVAVADQFQFICDKSKKNGYLPAALRKALIKKFSDFDAYQLAKHNKGKLKKRNQNFKSQNETNDPLFSLKRLIGLLHIKDPAELVMGILKKKYPDSLESFTSSRLSGTWDESRAGKRMKLPIPITWETELSKKGNKKLTWEGLIDTKKLPYMATLRNLRNLILAGISQKHHDVICNYIKNKKAVINSRQFPYRFYTALDILEDLQNTMYNEGPQIKQKKFKSDGIRRINSANFAIERKKKQLRNKIMIAKKYCSKNLFGQYKNALEEAIAISAFFNIPPIQGRTLIFLDRSSYMDVNCMSSKGLGKPMMVSKLAKVITEMCSKVCERCDINEFSTETTEYNTKKTVYSMNSHEMLKITRDKEKVDTLIFITNDEKEEPYVKDWITQHRVHVNSNLLYVHVALAENKTKVHLGDETENDIYLVGYTDAIFRFISERNNGDRMNYIDNLDRKYKLEPLPHKIICPEFPRLFSNVGSQLRWQTVKIFISSTFLDMHSERDLLVRHIFPELRRRAKALCMDVHEVDLRWGIKESEENSVSETCLDEVLKCQLFIGLLGQRYGFIPNKNSFSWNNPALHCLRNYPEGASITEMEMYLFALCNFEESSGRAFFYLRNDDIYPNLHNDNRHLFEECDSQRIYKLSELKKKIITSGHEVYKDYPCTWDGVLVNGLPKLVGLEMFGQRVLENVWNALLSMRQQNSTQDLQSDLEKHEMFTEKYHQDFIGNEKTISYAMKILHETERGLVLLHGKKGSGKTASMAHIYNLVKKRWFNRCVAIPFFTGASNSMVNLSNIIYYLAILFGRMIDAEELNTANLGIQEFYGVIEKVVENCGKLIIFLDGLDNLSNLEQQTDIASWLNVTWPKGVIIICSCCENSSLYKKLRHSISSSNSVLAIGKLSLQDRNKFIRNRLFEYGKQLDETFFNNQLKQLILKRDSDLPLYLSLACEELRVFGQFEKVSEKIRFLKNSVEGLLEDSIVLLERDFGVKYVAAAFSFLAICPNGLTEEELYYLLGYFNIIDSQPIDYIKMMYPRCRLPLSTFINLVRVLRRFIRPLGNILNMSSATSLLAVVEAKYKSSFLSSNGKIQLHRILASHLWKESNAYGVWTEGTERALIALPYHLAAGGCHDELKEILCDLYYIQARFLSSTVRELLEDYRYAVEMVFSQTRFTEIRKEIEEFRSFVKKNWKILNAEPLMVFQQAVNEDDESRVAIVANYHLVENANVLRLKNKNHINFTTKMTFNAVCSCVVLSPDNQIVAFGDGSVVQVYDLILEKKISTLIGHAGVITCLLFVGQSRLCSGSADGTISIWNLETGHRLMILHKHLRRISSICVDSTGRCLISAGWDGAIYVWRLCDGELISTLSWNSKWSAINCVASHPQKPMIVTGSWDSKLRIWCLQTLKKKSLLHGHEASIVDVCISPCGSLMASSSLDAKTIIWSCANGFQIAIIEQGFNVNSLCFHTASDRECHLLAGCANGSTQIYSCAIGHALSEINASHKYSLTCCLITIDFLVIGYEDGFIKLIKCGKNFVNEKIITAQLGECSVMTLKWHRVLEKNLIFSGLGDGNIKILDESLNVIMTVCGHNAAITALIISPKCIISGDETGVIGVTNKPWKKETATFNCPHMSKIHLGRITSLSFNYDYSCFVSTGEDQKLKFWRLSVLMLKFKDNLNEFEADLELDNCHNDFITASCWIEHNANKETSQSFVVTAGKDLRLCAWNQSDGQQMWEKSEFNAPINQLYSTKIIICGFSLDGKIFIWNSMGVTVAEVEGYGETISSVFFDLKEEVFDWYKYVISREDQEQPATKTAALQTIANDLAFLYVAKCYQNGLIKIIKPCFNTKPKEVVMCHRQDVVSVACGNRNLYASSSLDGTVYVWTSNFDSIEQPVKHLTEISCITLWNYRVDCILVLTGDRKGYLMIWSYDDSKWDLLSKNKVHRKTVNSVAVLNQLKSTIYIVTSSNDYHLKFWCFAQKLFKSNKDSDLIPKNVCKLEYSFDEQQYEMFICLDYLPKANCLSSGLTGNTLICFKPNFDFNSVNKWSIALRNYADIKINSLDGSVTSWILHLRLISDEKMNVILVFSVNSFCELWVTKHDKSTFSKLTYNKYGAMAELWENNSNENSMNSYPTSMDICLVEYKDQTAILHQCVGMTNGFLLSLRLKFDFNDNEIEVVDRYSIKLHEGAIKGLCYLRTKTDNIFDPYVMIFTGGNDGVVRQSKLELMEGNFIKMMPKFFCEGSVTCVKAMQKNNEIFIGCSDTLGHTYALTGCH